jgi:glycosyltransferase involved in cell wall biosynthesis
MKLDIIEPTLQDYTGHCHAYMTSLLNAQNETFPNLKLKLWIGRRSKYKQLFQIESVVPFFYYKIRKIQLFFLYRSLIKNHNHIFVPTAGMIDLVILHKLLKNSNFLGSVHLHFHQFNLTHKKQRRLQFLSNNDGIFHIMTPTDRLTNIFLDHGFTKVSTVPCPLYSPPKNINSSNTPQKNSLRKVLYTGAARADKGFINVVKFIQQSLLKIHFHIQAPKPHNGKYNKKILPAINLLEQLNNTRKNLTVSYKSASPQEYQSLFINSITLLIYNVEDYKDKFSGILLESLYMGAPVIVTEGTWFSQVIHKYKAGIIVKPGNMNEITQAISNINENYDEYTKKATYAGKELFQKHQPKNTLQAILNHCESIHPYQ